MNRIKTSNRKKKISFVRTWVWIALPVIALTIFAMVMITAVLFIGLYRRDELRASEIAYEATLRLKEKDLTAQREYEEILNLEKSRMVAALYDEKGNLLCESKPEEYEAWRQITKEDYRILLERLKEIPMNSQRERAGAEKVNLYGVSYLYGRKYFTADDKVYQLRYGALVSPWSRYSRSIVMTDLAVIFSVLLLTFLIARHYYRSYRERIQAEEYYRNTSNALAHDLKTPLMAISGYAEIMQENAYPEKRNYYAEGILKNVAVMNAIIENVLELARLENPRMIPAKEDTDLWELAGAVLEQFQVEIRSKELNILLKGQAGEAVVSADKALMKRALENLIGNAVRYTPEENEITITLNMKCLEIKNTGVMISEDKLPHVWEPFVKGENARAGTGGTGIGLTIVKEIMDLHGFDCEIRNGDSCVIAVIDFRKARGSKRAG